MGLDVLDVSVIPMMILDTDLRFVLANEALGQHLGREVTELVGRNVSEFVETDDLAMVRSYAEDPPATSGTQLVHFVHRDGSTREALVAFSMLPTTADEPQHWFAQVVDLTERRATEAKLHRLHRLATVLAETNEAVFRATTPTEIFEASARIAVEHGEFVFAWFGLVDDDAHLVVPVARGGAGAEYLERLQVSTLDDPAGRGPSGTAARTGTIVICNDIAGDDAMLPWQSMAAAHGYKSSAACPLWVEGRVSGVLSVYAATVGFFNAEEIVLVERLAANVAYGWEAIERETWRQASEAALGAQREQAHRLESLGQLAGGIAHDFNNLLGVILNYSTLLERQIHDAGALEDIGQIKAAAERAAALTHQMLTFARRDSTSHEPIEVNGVIRGIASMLERSFGAHINLHLDLSPERLVTVIDQHQLEQIVLNLAINARDAMPASGRLTISTEASWPVDRPAQDPPPQADVILRIADTGHGMSPEVAARAFEPFFSTKPRGEGTGLGLATVYGIVQQHGGEVTIESEVGRGSTIIVSLPGAPEPSGDPGPPVDAPLPSGGHERILVVEDEDALRVATARILTDHGYEVVVAADGVEALELLDGGLVVDAVLTDLAMPRMQGDELAHHLAERHPTVKVAFMSGYDSGDRPLTGRLISKPASEAELLYVVRESLDD